MPDTKLLQVCRFVSGEDLRSQNVSLVYPSLLCDCSTLNPSRILACSTVCCACFGAGTLTHFPLHFSSSPLAHFSTARKQVADSEGPGEAPAMDTSYMLGEPPAASVDFDESPWRGCAVASVGGGGQSYEVRGVDTPLWLGQTLLRTLVQPSGT